MCNIVRNELFLTISSTKASNATLETSGYFGYTFCVNIKTTIQDYGEIEFYYILIHNRLYHISNTFYHSDCLNTAIDSDIHLGK